jgi:hypothetical protein
MSSRLFESLAAGAVIICDENRFAHRFFGKTLLYIDSRAGGEEVYQQVQNHLDWIRSEPKKALELASEAQQIFLANFSLDRCLQNIYSQLPARKKKLETLYAPRNPETRVSVILLMPEYHPDVLQRHIKSVLAQKHVSMRPILLMDGRDFEIFGARVRGRLEQLPIPFAVEVFNYFERGPNGAVLSRKISGQILYDAMQEFAQDDYFCIVAPNEQLFSDHLTSLLRTLEDRGSAGCAWADLLLSHISEGSFHADLSDDPADSLGNNERPIGFGRFLFRKSALRGDLGVALPYLDALPMHLLFGLTESVPTKRCTMLSDVQHHFNLQIATTARVDESREIIRDYAPDVFKKLSNVGGPAGPLSLDSMTSEQKTKLAVELAHSVPVPAFLKKIGFGVYRFWLRRHNART